MSLAAKWASWERRRGGSPAGPMGGADLDTTTFSPKVELFIDEAWVDITRLSKDEAGVYYRDRISITRGRSDEAGQADPSRCTFTLNNRDGRFSPTNPSSPYYGKLGRNTPVRVSISRNSIRRYRFYGEISSWPVQWDISGQDVYIPIEASGIKRRLQQNNSPLKSAMYRDMTSARASHIVAYWPMEDVAGSASLASAQPTATPMTFSGTPRLADFSDWLASDALPTANTATFRARVPRYTVTGETSIRFFCNVGAAVPATYQELVRLSCTGTASNWWVSLKSDGSLRLISKDDSDNTLVDTGDVSGFAMNTAGLSTITIELTQSGSDVVWNLVATYVLNGTSNDYGLFTYFWTGTLLTDTVGRVTTITLGAQGGLGDVALGHLSLADSITAYASSSRALVAWNDESPAHRFTRLCAENGLSGVVQGDTTDNSITVGSQHASPLVALLEECADTDIGMLFEPRDRLGFTFRPRLSLTNQPTSLALDYADHELADALNPVYDDQKIVNDLALTRNDGSSLRDVVDTGPMSINDPSDPVDPGVGRYDDAQTISLGFDGQLSFALGFRLLLGTVDEARFPTIALRLAHPAFTDNVSLMNQALTFDIGDIITIDNPPDHMAPDQIRLLVQGYSETLDQFEYDMTVNCSPASPFQAAVYDTDRYDTASSSNAVQVDEDSTIVSVATTLGPVWTQDSNEFPFDVMWGGERVTVTNVTGSTSPQTFTVTRSINGIAKAHPPGDDIRLADAKYRSI